MRFLSVCYMTGAVLHLADIFNLNLQFSEMNLIWKGWIIFLLVGDTLASIWLWKRHWLGTVLFLLIATAQLVAYLLFKSIFGQQSFLIGFHVISVGIWIGLTIYNNLTNRANTA